MAIFTIVDNDFVSLWCNPDRGLIHHQCHKILWGDAYRELLTKGLDALKQHGATKWLSDNREHGPLGTEDTEWSLQDWFPRAIEAGWRIWAIVPPVHVVGVMTLNRLVDRSRKLGVTSSLFDDPTAALLWLERQGTVLAKPVAPATNAVAAKKRS